MLSIEQLQDKFEAAVNKYIKCYYGFTYDAPVPCAKYEVSFTDGDDDLRMALLDATIEVLVIWNADTDLKAAHNKLYKKLILIKNELTSQGFRFEKLSDAVVFDEKGNATDLPAKVLKFKNYVEFA